MESMSNGDGDFVPKAINEQTIRDIESFFIADQMEAEESEIITIEAFSKSYANISHYSKKSYIEKLGTLQNLAYIAHDIGKEKTIDTILPILTIVAKEEYSDLKLEMLKHISEIINILNDKGEGYSKIIEKIWPVVKMLQNDDEKVIEQANLIMLKLTDTLTEEDVGTHILAYILSLAHDEENIECKIKALSLLNMMAPKLGKNYCQQYVVHEVASLASEAEHQLRKAVCQNFIKICETVGTEIFHSKLFDVYKILANDTLWSVKKAAAEIIVEISRLCLLEKKQMLIGTMEIFLHDQNKWVKQSSHEHLGPFITSLPKHIIPESLIEEFINMSDKKKNTEEEMFQCAFYMPGVLLTVGEKLWGLLGSAYKTLFNSKIPKIKETLASSLHEFLKNLSSDYHQVLFDYFDQFLNEKGENMTRLSNSIAS